MTEFDYVNLNLPEARILLDYHKNSSDENITPK